LGFLHHVTLELR